MFFSFAPDKESSISSVQHCLTSFYRQHLLKSSSLQPPGGAFPFSYWTEEDASRRTLHIDLEQPNNDREGGIPETTALLQQQPWGLIFFTGSQTVGKIVAQHAAETLTPVVLELGGKCPCYIDGPTCPTDMRQVANRILWTKTFNGGQTCAAVDTLIVHEAVIDKLIPHLMASLRIQFGDDPYSSELGEFLNLPQVKSKPGLSSSILNKSRE